MDNNALAHHGIKGMRWGIRRFQNKDGTLTSLGKKKKRSQNQEDKEETVEERRARLLKSTDASEIYKNRDILSTAEINERLNRIDTEARLSRVAENTKKSGMDYIDKALKVGRKVNEIYEFTNTPVMKALKKKLLGEVEEHMSPDLKNVWENRDKISDKKLSDVLKRVNTEKAIKKMLDEQNEVDEKAERLKKAQQEVDDYNKKRNKSSTYRMKGDNIPDNKTGTGNRNANSRPRIETKDYYEPTGKEVFGKGTSKYSQKKNETVIDAEEGKDFWFTNSNIKDAKMSDVSSSKTTAIGQKYIAGLLEDKSKDDD